MPKRKYPASPKGGTENTRVFFYDMLNVSYNTPKIEFEKAKPV
jgi:hypothetical protein